MIRGAPYHNKRGSPEGISEQATYILESLTDWIAANNGVARVSSDEVDLLYNLANRPGKIQALIIFDKELPRGEFEEAGEVDRHFRLIITRGSSMQLNKDDALIAPAMGGEALYDLVEQARDIIRGLTFRKGWTEETPRVTYVGMFRGHTARVTDSYEIEFSIGCQLGAIISAGPGPRPAAVPPEEEGDDIVDQNQIEIIDESGRTVFAPPIS